MEMQFGDITFDDLSEVINLQPDGWPDIGPEFEFYIRKKFCYPVKAILESKIVGVGTLIVFDDSAWMAHIIVDQNHRNKGVGSQITQKLVNDGTVMSVKTLLLIATELGLPVYKKLGFSIVSEYLYFRRDRPWRDFQISPNIIPYKDSFDSIIFELDKEISGENRRLILADYLENSLVFIENNSAIGFYLPDLGEGLILADNSDAGLELMKLKYSKADKAVLPVQNYVGTEFLKQNGFTLSDTKGTRMILGKEIDWKPKQVFSRIGGNYG